MNEADIRIKFILQLKDVATLTRTELVENLTGLRNLCARSPLHQHAIATNNDLNYYFYNLVFGEENDDGLQKLALQVIANSIVNNATTQRLMWEQFGEALLNNCRVRPLGPLSDIILMIVYNVYIGQTHVVSPQQTLCAVNHVWDAIIKEKSEGDYEFVHIIFEHFLTKEGGIVASCYSHFEVKDRLIFLSYLTHYLRQDSPNGNVHDELMLHISKVFKMHSDCLLRETPTQSDNCNAREMYALLGCIASASGSERYSVLYKEDQALFLNVSSLLRCLIAAGKKDTPNIFTPMEKLEEVAPNSNIERKFEQEISFELKTLLMRCITNLLYENKKNKEYCVDTQLIPAMLECTKRDARNPLLCEWSLLALRNACVGSPQIQDIVAGISNQGPAENNVLNELNLSMGSMRIQPNRD